jgi:sugar O-acyltransferase (sialic acid O-acetyltransferase NeuD family)
VRIVLYAVASSHASELVETAARLGWEIAAAIRNLPDLPVPPEVAPVVSVEALDRRLLELEFAVPQTNPAQRYAAIADARARGFRRAATMVDPTAVTARSTMVGRGAYVGAGSVIGAAAMLRDGCLVNRSCSVAHHVVFGDDVTTGPGVVVSGAASVEPGAFLGAAAVIAPEVRVGSGAVVGAGAVVIRDVAAGQIVVGNPARELKRAEVPAGVPWS